MVYRLSDDSPKPMYYQGRTGFMKHRLVFTYNQNYAKYYYVTGFSDDIVKDKAYLERRGHMVTEVPDTRYKLVYR